MNKKLNSLILISIIFLMIGNVSQAVDMASPPNSLVVDDTGYVGIGLASPATPVHVKSSNDTSAIITVETTGNAAVGNQVGFQFLNGGPGGPTQHQWDVRPGGVGNLIFNYNGGGSEFTYKTNGNLTITGSLSQGSSRRIKQDITDVDTGAVLDKVMGLKLSHWRYNKDPKVQHLGPMSEDFARAFPFGGSDKSISAVDADGIALAAIQGLKAEKDAELAQRDATIKGLQEDLQALKKLVQTLAASDKLAALTTQ